MNSKKLTVLILLMLCIGAFFCACDKKGGEGDGKGESFTVTCYLYGTIEAPTTYEAVDGVLRLPSIPTRMGYTFNGLFDAPSGGSMVMDPNGNCLVVFDRAMTIYAQWTAQNCYIVFDGQGGEVPVDETEMTVTYGSTVTRFPTATREGYTFVGWEDANGNRYTNGASVLREKQTFNDDNYTFDGDTVRLFAAYEISKYTVVFDYNDGTYRTLDITVEHGQPIPEDQYPTEGLDSGTRRVSGWALSADGTQPFMGTVKNNMTLYAIWKDYKTFTLHDTVGKDMKIYVYRDEIFDLQSFDGVTRPGYDLDGWYTNVTYAGNPVTEIQYTSPDKDYYAKWAVATYSLVFDQNSAGKTIAPLSYQMGDTFELEVITREGLTFRGWSAVADGTGEVFTTLPATFWGNHTLYAIYEPAFFDVTLWSDGGALPSGKGIVSLEYTKMYELPIPEKEGFVFQGWFDSAENNANRLTDEKGASLAAYNLIGESTAYAHWTPVTYTVTFNTNGGSAVSPLTVNHGDKLELPADPTLKGKIFTGWYSDKELTKRVDSALRVTANVTLYANWIISNPISSVEELKLIATNPDANYHLTKNINLGGAEWTPIPEYRGILDGKGYKIYNFTISANTTAGFITSNAGTIQNLTLSDFNFTVNGDSWTGVVVGSNSGTIQNCSVLDGIFTSNTSVTDSGNNGILNGAGGICGNNVGTIEGCVAEIRIYSNTRLLKVGEHDHSSLYTSVGGIVGIASGSVKNCSTSCIIESTTYCAYSGPSWYATASSTSCVGGIVGFLRQDGQCINVLSESNVFIVQSSRASTGATYAYAGGVVGLSEGLIEASVAKGRVEENAQNSPQTFNQCGVGGFVGINKGNIINCYSTADTLINTGTSYNAGFVYQNLGNVSNCYASGVINSNVAGPSCAGFIAHNVAGGNINKCFAAGNIVGATTANTGSFVVTAETGSSCFKHYYSSEMTVTVNNIPASPANLEGEAVNPERIKTEAFLYDTLSWGSDVWRIPADGYPVLVWQD